jgi:hypothetical protein
MYIFSNMFGQLFFRDRFLVLLKYLHFNDNSSHVANDKLHNLLTLNTYILFELEHKKLFNLAIFEVNWFDNSLEDMLSLKIPLIVRLSKTILYALWHVILYIFCIVTMTRAKWTPSCVEQKEEKLRWCKDFISCITLSSSVQISTGYKIFVSSQWLAKKKYLLHCSLDSINKKAAQCLWQGTFRFSFSFCSMHHDVHFILFSMTRQKIE